MLYAQHQAGANPSAAVASEAGELARNCQREVTPATDMGAPAQGGSRSGMGVAFCKSPRGPITPDAAVAQPASAPCMSAAAAGEAEQGAQASVAAVTPGQTVEPSAVASRVHAFVRCVASAPLLQSALLWMELNGRHPMPEGMLDVHAAKEHGLHLTIAQLLALHLRSQSQTGGCCCSACCARFVCRSSLMHTCTRRRLFAPAQSEGTAGHNRFCRVRLATAAIKP